MSLSTGRRLVAGVGAKVWPVRDGDPGATGGRGVCVRHRVAAEGHVAGVSRRGRPALPDPDFAPTAVAGGRTDPGRRMGPASGGPGPRISRRRPGPHFAQSGHSSAARDLDHRPEDHRPRLVGRGGHGGRHRGLPLGRLAAAGLLVAVGRGLAVGRVGRPRGGWLPHPPRSTPSWRRPGIAPRLWGRRVLRPASRGNQGFRSALVWRTWPAC